MSQSHVQVVAERAREASYSLATATRPQKDAALLAMADALEAASRADPRPPMRATSRSAEEAGTSEALSIGCG